MLSSPAPEDEMPNAKLYILLFLILATAMEVTGDAIVRLGIGQQSPSIKLGYFIGGGLLLFGYGYALNSAPIEFEKVVGIYIATLFVMWQVISFLFFRHVPTLPILLGGSLIVGGGLIVAFWSPGATPAA
jgi:small multidrug resistance family-3 protein